MSLRFLSTTWLLLLVFLMTGCDPGSSPASIHDKQAMQGEWVVVAGESRSGSGGIDGETITFSGDTFTHRCGSIKFNAVFSVDAGKSPKEIDFTNAVGTVDPGTSRGPDEPRNVHGIYDVKDDAMRLCIDESAAARPSGFFGYGPNVMLILKRK